MNIKNIIITILIITTSIGYSSAEFGAESCYNTVNTEYNAVAKLDDTHIVVAYKDTGGSGYGCAKVGIINGSIITWGAELCFNSASTDYISIDTFNSSHFVVSYRDDGGDDYGCARIGSVLGTTISSFGAENIYNSAGTIYTSVVTLNSTHFVVVYRDIGNSNYGTAIVGAISGTTISGYGAENVFNTASSSYLSVSILDNTHFIVVYTDGGNSNYGTGIIGEISGTTISNYGAENVFNTATSTYLSVSTLDNTHFIVVYTDGDGNLDYGMGIIGEVSGTTISNYGAENVFNTGVTYYSSVSTLNSTHFVIGYRDSTNFGYGTSITGETLLTTISNYSNENIIISESTDNIDIIETSSTNYIVVYRNNNGSGYGCSKAWGTPISDDDTKITLLSFDPDPIHTNYSGKYNITYGISHNNSGIDPESVAFLFALNYTLENAYNHSIRVPPNTIATTTPSITEYGDIFRGFRRNVTPYLTQEFNDTITEGNIWKWGMYDHLVYPHVKIEPHNSTYTFVNVTSYRVMVLEQMHYLAAFDMFVEPKTDFEISVDQSYIFKMWDVEQINDRNNDYLIFGYFGTGIGAITPGENIEITICNNSFDPLVDDFSTCPYCEVVESWDVDRWNTHTLNPHANAAFAEPLIINASEISFELDAINYGVFSSDTASHKPYIIKVTDGDPGICNLTWAQTDVSWAFDEIGGTSSSYPYTPGIFYNFIRDYQDLEIKLYASDNNSVWGYSGIDTFPIGLSYVPISPISFEYFNTSVDGDYCLDSYMDATYDGGSIDVGIRCPADQNGGTIDHNITLYYSNKTFVGVVNDTLSTNGIENLEINFVTSPYYSLSDSYTLKCVSTDENSVTQTRWLNSNFTLAADGTTGYIINSHVSFWGFDDLPSLYSAISNSSILSYSAIIDTYTMHIPFFKSKCNDTFLIDHDLRLLSNNDPGVSYFRYIGETYINDSRICSWNTGYNNYAYDIATERAYIISTNNAKGGYFNSEFMYLGADIIRQEGVNIINSNGFNIDNCLFTHNNQGIIFEYSDSIILNNSELSHNEEVSMGIYYTNNSIIHNNIIHNNGKDGIRIYGSFYTHVSDNSIYENDRHGIWCQVTQNATLIHNTIYDTPVLNYHYYFSHDSLNNTLLEPLSNTNRIRTTSSSGVIIRNDDNKIFGHNSINFISKAYPYYFYLEMKGISETITITNYDFKIIPTSGYLNV